MFTSYWWILRRGFFSVARSNDRYHQASTLLTTGSVTAFLATMSSSIPPFVKVTPFGVYCQECDTSLSLEKGIPVHAKEFHPTTSSFKNASIVRSIKEEMNRLRERHSNDFSSFLKTGSKAESLWYCTICFIPFGRKSNYQRHVQSSRNGLCLSSNDGKIDLFPTICGRKGPKSLVQSSQSIAPPAIITANSMVSSLTFSNLSRTPSNNKLYRFVFLLRSCVLMKKLSRFCLLLSEKMKIPTTFL